MTPLFRESASTVERTLDNVGVFQNEREYLRITLREENSEGERK